MVKKISNVSDYPEIYYGLHFVPGVAEYREKDHSYRIFLSQDTLQKMNKSFSGKPVYVEHVEEVNLKNLQTEADGYVVESFYNPYDGKTWAKFIVITDKAKDHIKRGWQLSNSYFPTGFAAGGEWNGVTFEKEITEGEFEHLAIVSNPRYAESIILTPEQFKEYNLKKEQEIKKIANSKGASKMKFNFFKKQKVENSTDLESMSVMLPKSKTEISIEKLINDADEAMIKKNDGEGSDEGKHKVKVGEHEMTVNELVEKYHEMKNELEALKKHNDDEDMKHNDDEEEKHENDDDEDMKHNDDEDKKHNEEEEAKKKLLDDAKKNEEEEFAKKKNDKKKHFDSLKNANKNAQDETPVLRLTSDCVALGKERY